MSRGFVCMSHSYAFKIYHPPHYSQQQHQDRRHYHECGCSQFSRLVDLPIHIELPPKVLLYFIHREREREGATAVTSSSSSSSWLSLSFCGIGRRWVVTGNHFASQSYYLVDEAVKPPRLGRESLSCCNQSVRQFRVSITKLRRSIIPVPPNALLSIHCYTQWRS